MLDTAKIKSLRIARGLTTKEAAHRAGFGSVYEWVRLENSDTGNCSLRTLFRLAKALECSAATLLRKDSAK